MKKSIASIACLSLLILCSGRVMALPTFGTLMPKRGQWQSGVMTDSIFRRDVKDYEDAKTTAYLYSASYGFADWFCVDGLIGLGDVEADHISIDRKLRYPLNFSGGYGWRAKLYRNETYGIDWALGFQHLSTHPADQWYMGRKYQIIWDEWQFSSTVSKRIWNFIPYCGMKWSFIYLIKKTDNNRNRRFSNGHPLGFVVGTDVRMNDYLYLNVESRFFDELALNAGFTVRY